ncbi:sensor histidine kinase [Streptomyces sp. NPDC047917]|uniref:sensor histidine kinase n=1 Tax=Streptomyces sp. NPDC047917 TaxID=3365491 RepID=UPI00370F8D42
MIRGIGPLLRGSTYSGVLFAYCGALASLPLLPFALLPAVLWSSGPESVRIVLVLLVWAVLVGSAGLVRPVRRALVASARRLLRVPLPDPVAGGRVSGSPGLDRWRTPLWLVLHAAVGWMGVMAGGTLFIMGIALPGNWIGGEARLSLFGSSLQATGVWSWVVGAVFIVLAVTICVLVAKLLRWSAPRLLGPSAAERLALAAEREMLLAERNRIAHELHDSIGHTLTAATIQAAVAGEMLAADPVAARAAMRSIEESTRAALEDLDYVLGVLREEESGTAPTRTLADLPGLLDRLRHAGAVVEPELSGDLAKVQGTLSRAAYRILQEGLTNALRHGAGGPIGIEVVAGPDALDLTVVNRTEARTDPGARPGAFPTSGHGLSGLAERVRLLHGEFRSGPDGTQHWRLAVRLPVRASA